MRECHKFFVGGGWVAPADTRGVHTVVNPATEGVAGSILMGGTVDVDHAVAAARSAFPGWSRTGRAERIDALAAIVSEYERRSDDLVGAVVEEMGAPLPLARRLQVPIGAAHFKVAIETLRTFRFEEERGTTRIVKEPIGVCGFITPWNWPLNQIACKVAPALATGCTMVLKPSEVAPFSAQIFAEILAAAGLPAGVFNLVHGDGGVVGAAIASHPGIDMVSITGSTRAGVAVAVAAAPTVKRVAQELGGKSANVLLDDASFAKNVASGVTALMRNSGQSCNAPSRMFVPAARMSEAAASARAAADALVVGDPKADADLGPVANETQFRHVQRLIEAGIDEGATLVAGGAGRPAGLDQGYFVRPTVFADVRPEMLIAREEIFGPVLAILPYEDLDDAIEKANDTEYGLAAYVSGEDPAALREVASRLRAGQIVFNGQSGDLSAPFGGYKMSGNGRERGDYAFHDFLEVKAMLGYSATR